MVEMKTISAKKGHALIEAFMAGQQAFRRGSDIRCHYKDSDRVDAFERGWRWEKEKKTTKWKSGHKLRGGRKRQ
jgi:hypothetical protein